MKRRNLSPQPAHQRGVVLMIALIMLVSMTLTGIILFRQIGTGVIIARNLTFKQSALSAADRGVEVARNWLVTGGANLQVANIAGAYYPAWCNTSVNASGDPDADNNGKVDDCKATPPPSEFNPSTYNWSNSVLVTDDDGNGNAIRYVIHRLCRIPGSLNATNSDGVPQECVTLGAADAGGSKGSGGSLSNTVQPYYRITTQATGPQNTVAYSQVILY